MKNRRNVYAGLDSKEDNSENARRGLECMISYDEDALRVWNL